jgi:hypothetical protein
MKVIMKKGEKVKEWDPEIQDHKWVDGPRVFDAESNLAQVQQSIVARIERKTGADYVGPLTTEAKVRIKETLKGRFRPERNDVAKSAMVSKQFGHLTLLANFYSSAVQSADVGMTATRMGFTNTLKAVVHTGRAKMNPLVVKSGKMVGADPPPFKPWFDAKMDAGITKAMHEMTEQGGIAKTVDRGMRLSGFSAIDNFNKDVLLTASIMKGAKLVQSRSGMVKMLNEYSGYGDEFVSKLARDLKDFANAADKDKGKFMTTEIKQYALMEAFDTQPINASQMPLWIQNHPNHSVATTLMSYTMKAFDIVRNDILYKGIQSAEQIAIGNWGKAAVHATEAATMTAKFAVLAGGTNASVRGMLDYVQGRDVYADEWMERWMNETLGMVFFPKHDTDQLGKTGDVNKYIAGLSSIPSFSVLAKLYQAAKSEYEMSQEELEPLTRQQELTMSNREIQARQDNFGAELTPQQDKARRGAQKLLPIFGKFLFGFKPFDDDVQVWGQTVMKGGKDVMYNKKALSEHKKRQEEKDKEGISKLKRITLGY